MSRYQLAGKGLADRNFRPQPASWIVAHCTIWLGAAPQSAESVSQQNCYTGQKKSRLLRKRKSIMERSAIGAAKCNRRCFIAPTKKKTA